MNAGNMGKASTRRENGANGARKRRTETLEAAREPGEGSAAESEHTVGQSTGINLVTGEYRAYEPGEPDVRGLPAEHVAVVNREREVAATPVTLTLEDLCAVIGYDVKPHRFAHDSLVSLAEQLDTLATGAQEVDSLESGEPFRSFMALRDRMRLAARIDEALRAQAGGES